MHTLVLRHSPLLVDLGLVLNPLGAQTKAQRGVRLGQVVDGGRARDDEARLAVATWVQIIITISS